MKALEHYDRYYLSYSGIRLPLKLVSPLNTQEIDNRNTYFGAMVDASGRTRTIHKVVYGAVEMAHDYQFNEQGQLLRAEIMNEDGELQTFTFDAE